MAFSQVSHNQTIYFKTVSKKLIENLQESYESNLVPHAACVLPRSTCCFDLCTHLAACYQTTAPCLSASTSLLATELHWGSWGQALLRYIASSLLYLPPTISPLNVHSRSVLPSPSLSPPSLSHMSPGRRDISPTHLILTNALTIAIELCCGLCTELGPAFLSGSSFWPGCVITTSAVLLSM